MMQLWGANNYRIDVTYDRIVPDAEHNVVVVDLLETVVSDHALQTAVCQQQTLQLLLIATKTVLHDFTMFPVRKNVSVHKT